MFFNGSSVFFWGGNESIRLILKTCPSKSAKMAAGADHEVDFQG